MTIIKIPYLNYYIVKSGKSFHHVYDQDLKPVGLKTDTLRECKLLIDELVYLENEKRWSGAV